MEEAAALLGVLWEEEAAVMEAGGRATGAAGGAETKVANLKDDVRKMQNSMADAAAVRKKEKAAFVAQEYQDPTFTSQPLCSHYREYFESESSSSSLSSSPPESDLCPHSAATNASFQNAHNREKSRFKDEK